MRITEPENTTWNYRNNVAHNRYIKYRECVYCVIHHLLLNVIYVHINSISLEYSRFHILVGIFERNNMINILESSLIFETTMLYKLKLIKSDPLCIVRKHLSPASCISFANFQQMGCLEIILVWSVIYHITGKTNTPANQNATLAEYIHKTGVYF